MWAALARLLGHETAVGLDSDLGPLERQVMDAIWARPGARTVRDIQAGFPRAAYTTLMTTLDRLYRKGLLDRERIGRAFAYRARWTREELTVAQTAATLRFLLDEEPTAARPLVSCFVDAVGERDEALLDELERLVREKRRQVQGP